ncbi:MAG: hypothetical protein Tsb0034_15910 [Ekhidna sp.]
MTSVQTEYGQLVYSKLEGGKEILLAFHGFGQSKDVFTDWQKNLCQRYTIYAFDLFNHGESSRSYGSLSKQEWKAYLVQFLEKEGIDRFDVLGYSLGGRFAIASALGLPDQTRKIILVAPDGVFLTPWFKLATNPTVKWLFKYFMLRPEKLEAFMHFSSKTKLVNPYIIDFVKKEMGDATNRKRVYVSWNHFKSLGYSKKQLIQLFSQHTFSKHLILGDRDRIIKPDKILPIIQRMGNFDMHILPLKHHQLVNQDVVKLIAKIP